MKINVLAMLAAILLLSACNQQPQPAAQPKAEDAAAATVPVATETTRKENPDFPAGMPVDFAYKIRSRNVEQTADGNTRRLVIEYKEGDRDSIDERIEASLAALGYRRYKTYENNSSIVGDYGKNGKRITVTTTPDNGVLQLDSDSKGTVYFVWKD